MTTPSAAELHPSHASVSYPRAFLLGIYTAAIEHGIIYVNDVAHADYPSLRAQFNRLRRKSDSSNKSFITEAHYLCSMGKWEPGPKGTGRVPVHYSRMADGTPTLSTEAGDIIDPASQTPYPSQPLQNFDALLPSVEASADELRLDPADIDSFVNSMMADISKDDD
jgi:hypothetical protein